MALCLAVNLMVAPSAAAQSPPLFNADMRLSHRFADDARNTPFGQQRVGSGDSLKNGATIGAVIGAVAFGAFVAALCHAYREEGGASCAPDALRFAAIGGAIGAGAGLAIDAARSDGRVTARLTIRFRWSFWNIAAADKVFSVRQRMK